MGEVKENMKHTYFGGSLNYKPKDVYCEETYKPPYEQNSTAIVVTMSKTHKKQEIFTVRDNIPLKIKLSLEENTQEDVIEVRDSIDLWKENKIERIFLVGNNIFKMKYERLADIANLIHLYFTKCKTLGCFCKVEDIESKSDYELRKLHEKGYDKLTIQMNINENKIYKYMENGYESDEIVSQCLRLDEAKIKYNIFYEEGKFYEEEGEIEAKLIKEILNELNPANILTSKYEVNNL